MNLTFTSPQTVLYQSTPGEQNSFVRPVFVLSLYLQPSTVVGLFQQGLPSFTPGTEPFSALCARFCQTSGDSDPSCWVCAEKWKPEELVNILCIVTLSKFPWRINKPHPQGSCFLLWMLSCLWIKQHQRLHLSNSSQKVNSCKLDSHTAPSYRTTFFPENPCMNKHYIFFPTNNRYNNKQIYPYSKAILHPT